MQAPDKVPPPIVWKKRQTNIRTQMQERTPLNTWPHINSVSISYGLIGDLYTSEWLCLPGTSLGSHPPVIHGLFRSKAASREFVEDK